MKVLHIVSSYIASRDIYRGEVMVLPSWLLPFGRLFRDFTQNEIECYCSDVERLICKIIPTQICEVKEDEEIYRQYIQCRRDKTGTDNIIADLLKLDGHQVVNSIRQFFDFIEYSSVDYTDSISNVVNAIYELATIRINDEVLIDMQYHKGEIMRDIGIITEEERQSPEYIEVRLSKAGFDYVITNNLVNKLWAYRHRS